MSRHVATTIALVAVGYQALRGDAPSAESLLGEVCQPERDNVPAAAPIGHVQTLRNSSPTGSIRALSATEPVAITRIGQNSPAIYENLARLENEECRTRPEVVRVPISGAVRNAVRSFTAVEPCKGRIW